MIWAPVALLSERKQTSVSEAGFEAPTSPLVAPAVWSENTEASAVDVRDEASRGN